MSALLLSGPIAACNVNAAGELTFFMSAQIAKPTASIDDIYRLQDEVAKLPQRVCPVKMHFAPHACAREMLIPAGTTIIGAVHRTEHISTISRGRVTVYTVDEGRLELDATEHPITFVSPAGIKRAVYAHEDTVWMTYHVTDKTDMEELTREITTSEYGDLLECRMALEGERL